MEKIRQGKSLPEIPNMTLGQPHEFGDRTLAQDVVELQDFSGTLGELQTKIATLIEQYGDKRKCAFDGGGNNVSFALLKRCEYTPNNPKYSDFPQH